MHTPSSGSPPPSPSPGETLRPSRFVDPRRHWERLKRYLPPWKIKLLSVSLVIAILGFGAQVTSKVLHHEARQPAAAAVPAVPHGGSGFVSGAPQAKSPYDPSAAPPAAPPSHTLTDTLTPWMGRLGISFFVGIVLGAVFRAFLKMAAIITVLVGSGFGALSYFNVLNLDVTRVKTQYSTATSWVEGQAGKIKDVALGALPSTSSAAAGFFMGFKRK